LSDLKEFLRKQAEEEGSAADERKQVLEDWIEALELLQANMSSWLRQADPQNILTLEQTTHRIRERQIGSYSAPGLRISLGTREVRVEPVARYSIGSRVGDALGASLREGRVDMTNGEKKYMLYRHKDGENHHWVMVDDEDYLARDMDRSAFEDAIQSLLE
jgi:hypothetical protein